jgi:DNA-3-methyladenine glycosylase I
MENNATTVCPWAEAHPLLGAYHDAEWGVPERDSRALWEKLVLDGFQAGLSWLTILKKRDAFREAFKGFDPEVVARFKKADVDKLLKNDGIIRSRAKIDAAIDSARIYVAIEESGQDFAAMVWGLAGGAPVVNAWVRRDQVPAKTAGSEIMSKALKGLGFKFVGPVIVYAWMQAVGMVNDHLVSCKCYGAVGA